MDWEVVKVGANAQGRTNPYASIGFGRISFSISACELLGDYENYQYVELLKGRRNNKSCIGVRFLHDSERTDNSLPIRRKKSKGKVVGGLDIANKGLLEGLFGPAASASKSTRYNVTIDENNKRILIMYLD